MNRSVNTGTLVIQALDYGGSESRPNKSFVLLGSAADHHVDRIEISPDTEYPLKPPDQESGSFSLRIYHINDLHGHLVRFTPEGDFPILSRLAGEIRQARSEIQDLSDHGILMISSGDDCSGSIFDELAYYDRGDLPINPCYQIYSRIGLDAACLGNHDLDHGLYRLLNNLQDYANFPVLAANLSYNSSLPQLIYPGAIVVIGHVRIGLIGLLTRAETRLKPDEGQIVNPVPVARNMVEVLKPYCDLTIILSHLGYCLEGSPVPTQDAGDVQLAESLPHGSVNLIAGGHSHTELNRDGFEKRNLVNGIPIVQAGQKGEFLGQVSMELSNCTGEVKDAVLIPTDQLPNDAILYDREIKPVVDWAAELLNRQIGRIDPLLQLNADEVQERFDLGEFGLANFINDALFERLRMHGYEVDFTMLDLSAIHCGFPQGDLISFGDCFEMMPYPDVIRFYSLSGSQLIELLNDNARRLKDDSQPRLDRGFLQFSSQIRYSITKKSNAQDSISQEMTYLGIPLEDLADRTFCAGTTCFSRVLSAKWEDALIPEAIILESYPYKDTDIILRHEIVAYIRGMGDVSPNGNRHLDGRLQILE